jgi:hypothetical protein
MSQDSKSSHAEKQQQAEPIEAGHGENGSGSKTAEARIWAAANKLIRDANEPFEEEHNN